MRCKKYICLLLLAFTLLFTSCSIQKRHYRKGYYVETNSNKENTVTKNDSTNQIIKYADDTSITTSRSKSVLLNKNRKHNCDTLILKDGNRLVCTINEVTKRSVRFKDCLDSNQIANAIDVEQIALIKFYNGKVKTTSSKKDSDTLIKAPLTNTGLVFGILAILLEAGLLLSLFNIYVLPLALVISLIVCNILAAVIAIALGFVSLRDIRKNPEVFRGKKTAIVEITLGLLSLVSWLIILILITI